MPCHPIRACHATPPQVRLLLLAALSGEHILYIGPPGTAKSELGRRLSRLCHGVYFERLLTRFSVRAVLCCGRCAAAVLTWSACRLLACFLVRAVRRSSVHALNAPPVSACRQSAAHSSPPAASVCSLLFSVKTSHPHTRPTLMYLQPAGA